MNKTNFAALAFASILAGMVPAAAQPPAQFRDRPTATVVYGDLDLSRPAGQAVLAGRIRRAADRLCATGALGIGAAMESRTCVDAALASAQPQVERAVALYGTPQFAGRSSLRVAGR